MGGGNHLIQGIHKNLPVLYRQSADPVIQRLVPLFLQGGKIFHINKFSLVKKPGKRVMLQKSEGFAFHHLVVIGGFKQHAHQRRMGQNFHNPVFYFFVFLFFQHFLRKSRTVHAVNFQNPFLHRLRAFHGGVNRHVAALGMSAHIKAVVELSRYHV